MNCKKHLLALVCLLALAMLTITACGKSKSSPSASPSASPITASSVVGTYHTSHAGEELILKADGTYHLIQTFDKKNAGTFDGTWTLKGDKISLKFPDRSAVGEVLGDNTIMDDSGEIWTKQ